ncbi:MAG: hypothetical protein Ta2B_06820 [Termitinemataceae bacterium]|nr:MAG: hypothetical protein Ta2B_06820 [Termitinemataceae bacterium]
MIFNLFKKELTIAKKWAIDGEQIEAQSIRRRIRNAVYGSLIGDIAGTSPTFTDVQSMLSLPELKELPPFSHALFRSMQNIIMGKEDFAFTEKPENTSVIAYIVPYIFVHELTFKEITNLVCRFFSCTGNDNIAQLGYALYINILLRLYHYDDFENAVDITLETAKESLQGTEYAMSLNQYECLYSKRIKTLSKNDLKKNKTTTVPECLQTSLWCCMNNHNLDAVVLAALTLPHKTAAVLSGVMAGLYFRDDISMFLPKISFDYNAVIDNFGDYCLKKRS